MKKFISLVAVALFTLPIFAEDVVVVLDSIDFRNDEIVIKQGAASPGDSVLAVKEGVTIGIDKGQNKGFCLTAFAHSSVTISATQNIKQLNFEFGQASGSVKDGGLDAQIAVGATEWTAVNLPSQARFAKITVTLGEGSGEGTTLDTISATEALARAQALEVGGTEKVAVRCLVASIKDAYSEQYGNITVWLNDDPTDTYGKIQAYRAKCSAEDGQALAEHDQVLVVGNLSHSTYEKDGETKHSYQIAQGAQLTRLGGAPQGIENVVLTEKANKVMVDGVLYIVRDGKMFDVRGAQVR